MLNRDHNTLVGRIVVAQFDLHEQVERERRHVYVYTDCTHVNTKQPLKALSLGTDNKERKMDEA